MEVCGSYYRPKHTLISVRLRDPRVTLALGEPLESQKINIYLFVEELHEGCLKDSPLPFTGVFESLPGKQRITCVFLFGLKTKIYTINYHWK